MPRQTLRIAAGTLMVAGISLIAAPLAAAAHTGHLYTYVLNDQGTAGQFATLSTTNGANTPLAAAPVNRYVDGADVFNEVAWSVEDVSSEAVDSSVTTWDHNTGALGAPIPLTANATDFGAADEVEVLEVWAADTLADGRKLAYVRYEVTESETTIEPLYVAFIDIATGATVPIVQLPEISGESPISWNGIATDPLTGVTHLFAGFQAYSHVSSLSIADAQITPLEPLDGLNGLFNQSTQFPTEADYQPDGKLWLLVGVNGLEAYQLVSFAPGSDLTTAAPTVLGDPNQNVVSFYFGATVLTYDPAALAATGGTPLGLLVPGALLFAGGLALLAIRRTRSAA